MLQAVTQPDQFSIWSAQKSTFDNPIVGFFLRLRKKTRTKKTQYKMKSPLFRPYNRSVTQAAELCQEHDRLQIAHTYTKASGLAAFIQISFLVAAYSI